jgi:spermidine synthase
VPMAASILLLIGSGAAALIYQTLWVKQLGLVVGIDVYAVTTGVSAFFAGLALGGALFGPWADRSSRPYAFYAWLEIGVALVGVAATWALGLAAPAFVALQGVVGPLAWLLPFLLIGTPAFLMGGTLPALLRALEPTNAGLGRASGWLYAANTAGGIVGTLATPFLLIPMLGVRGSAVAAASLNVLLALLALAIDQPRPVRGGPAAPAVPIPRDPQVALALYAIAGGVALGYEVVWSQIIVQFINTRAYAFAIVLGTYLSGLVLGSALYARLGDHGRRAWVTFGVLEVAAGLTALATFAALGPWLPRWQEALGHAVLQATSSVGLATCVRFALAAGVVVFVPTVLLGAAFPAAVRLVAGAAHVGRDVGAVIAVNTAGGIAGTFLTGFVAIPLLGLARTLGVLTVTATAVGAIAIVRGTTVRAGRLRLAAGALVVIVAAAAAGVPRDKLPRLLVATRGGRLDFYEESPGGTVAVIEEPHFSSSFRRLYIQGVSNSGDAMMSLRYMRLQALLPLIIHRGAPRAALVVGLGTGITCGSLLAYPELEERVCAELLPAVVRATSRFHGNYGAATDPRIALRITDGRHELLRSTTRYDLITLEPPPPIAAGVANLYSRDFYELCRDRLAPFGLMAQWWPLATQNDEDSRSLVRSLLEVFPYATLWTTELHEMLLVGSMQPIELDAETIVERFEQPSVADALRAGGVSTPAALLATYVTDRAGLETYVGDAPPVTDDRPIIEYAGWMRSGEFLRVLPRVMASRREVPLAGGDETLRRAIETERRRLMTFYQASLHYYAREPSKTGPLMTRLLDEDPDNPYYRWFLGR